MATAKTVRAWARENGFTVGVKGLLAPAVWDAYATAHGEPVIVREKPDRKYGAIGRCSCGREWGGFREAHCTVCHRHFSTVRNFDLHQPGACLDPSTILDRDGEPKLQVRESVWGPLWVLAGEHYLTNTYEGKHEDAGLYGDLAE